MAVVQTASGTEIEARGSAGETIKAGVVAGIIGGMLMAMMPIAWFISHLAFGIGVGSAPGLRRRFAAS